MGLEGLEGSGLSVGAGLGAVGRVFPKGCGPKA